MKIFDLFGLTLRNLSRRKLRTSLTVMGVVVGTCMIVIMFSLGYGMEASLKQSLEQMGDLTQIQIYNYGGGGGLNEEQAVLDDAAIASIQALPHVEAATPFWNPNAGMVFYAGKKDRYQMHPNLIGVYPEALEKFGFEYIEGGGFNENSGKKISVILGEEAAYDFRDTKAKGERAWTWKQEKPDGTFTQPFIDPIKDEIRLVMPPSDEKKAKALEYEVEVSGILKGDYSKGYQSVYGVFMTIHDLQKLINAYNKENGIKNTENGKKKEVSYQECKVKVDTIENVEAVEAAIKEMGFETDSMESIRKPMQEQVRSQQTFYGIIGGVTLVVAAIGIINTMIMSIYERTREIGVMKVLGCVVGNIRTAYLMEAGMIGLIGGIIGVGLSYIASWALNIMNAAKIMGGGSGIGGGMGMGMMMGAMNSMESGGIPPTSIIPFSLAVYAVIFSIIIGVISGIIPAFRATRISALEAIKHD